MFAPKRSRKEKQGTLCSVQGSVFVSPLSPSSSLEALSSNQTKGGGSTMALFPERCLSAIYVREKRRENKGEKWRKYIYRGRGATLGELTFETGRMSGRDGTLRIWRVANASSAIVAWFRVAERRHVSISWPPRNTTPRRRNVTRKRADPRSTRHAFLIRGWDVLRGRARPLIGRRPANAFPCRSFFSMARKLLVESIPVGRIVVGVGKSAGKYCYCKFVRFPLDFLFPLKNKHRSKRCIFIYVYL